MIRNIVWWNEGIKVDHLLCNHLLPPSLSEGDTGDELHGAVDPLPVVNIVFIKEEGVISPGEEHHIEKVQLNLRGNYHNLLCVPETDHPDGDHQSYHRQAAGQGEELVLINQSEHLSSGAEYFQTIFDSSSGGTQLFLKFLIISNSNSFSLVFVLGAVSL